MNSPGKSADEAKAKAIVMGLLSSGKTKTDIAAAIGYHRSSISRWISEADYNGEHLAADVLARFDVMLCPHLGREIPPGDCHAYALRPCPTSSTREVRHWRACQTCPHAPRAPITSEVTK